MGRPLVATLLLALSPTALLAVGYPSPDETRAELGRFCRSLQQSDDPFFGTQIVPQLESRVEASDDPLVGTLLRARLGTELMRLDEAERATRYFEEALALLQKTRREEDRSRFLQLLYLKGLANLQMAEDVNCLTSASGASCILPLAPEAIHRNKEPARRAGDLFLEVLRRDPEHLAARWLLDLSRMLSGDYPEGVPEALRLPPDSFPTGTGLQRWNNIAARLGIDAVDLSGGAVMDDFDGDGFLDLVSTSWDPCEPMKAFRNDGHGGFVDVAREWGLDGQLGGLNLVQTDYDGDGRLDLLVLRGAWMGASGRMRNSLLHNDLAGDSGRFQDVTAAAGLAYPAFPTQAAAWADFDLDGDLDVYVANEATAQSADPLALTAASGNPYPSQLFRNNGDGTFTDIARQAGVTNLRFAKGTAWGDYDDDGDPDLFVSNIGTNRLYRNDRDGSFTDVAADVGVAEPSGGTFATWFFDYDNDGDLDLFVASYAGPREAVYARLLGVEGPDGLRPLLYQNEGGRFRDVSREVGLDKVLLIMGSAYGDLDNDGFPDLHLGTGTPRFEALMPNVTYRNVGGHRFEEVTYALGLGHLQKGHGVAFGDLDHDGDQDLFQQMGGAYPYDAFSNALYENPGTPGARWITLLVEGPGANRVGIGTRIAVDVRSPSGPRTVHFLVGPQGSFGGSSLRAEIGLGDAEAIDAVRVRWAGSKEEQVLPGVPTDHSYRLVHGAKALEPVSLPPFRLGGDTSLPTEGHDHEGPG